jgi:hypothetical protein
VIDVTDLCFGAFEADADLQRAQLAAFVVSSDDAIVG